jgi:DNA-binding PucR family transcriptional regulator
VRTYLDLDCNAASTASALDVNRHTVQRRLKKIEEAIGERLSARRAELDVVLRLERLTAKTAEDELAASSAS